MNILLTGGSGFVGKNVKEYLQAKGYQIYAPSSHELDCLDEIAVREHLLHHKYDLILCFAVYGDGM